MRARAGAGGSVLLLGEDGSGRSRMLREVAGYARQHGDVVAVRGHRFERDRPYAAMAALLAERGTDPNGIGDLHELSADGLFALLHRPGRPLLITVDDAHLVDPQSLRCIGELALGLGQTTTLLVIATRAPLPGELPELVPAVVLRPLSEHAVEVLVRSVLGPGADPGFCAECARLTAGNPRALRELLLAVQAAGCPPAADRAAELRELAMRNAAVAVRAALARCSDDAVLLAGALALVVPPDPERGAKLAGLTDAARDAAVAELQAAGVLRGDATLSTPLTAAALIAATPSSRQGTLRRAAAQATADPLQAAEHLLHVPAREDAWVARTLVEAAGLRVARGEPQMAVVLLERALTENAAQTGRATVLFALGQAQTAAGLPGALEHMREALEQCADPAQRTEIARVLAQELASRGDYRQAGAVVEEELERLPHQERERAADLGAAVVSIDHDPEVLRARAAAILERPSELDRPADRVTLVEAAHDRMLRNAPLPELLALARRAWADGRLLEEQTPASTAIAAIAGVLSWAGELEECLEVLTAAEQRAKGSVLAEATVRASRAWAHCFAGHLDAAWADAECARAAEGSGWAMFIPTARAVAAHVALQRDDLAAAEAALEVEEPPRWPSTRTTGPYYAPYFDVRARLRLQQARPAEALADARAAGELLQEHSGSPAATLVDWRDVAARALELLGEPDAAIALAEEALDLACASGGQRQLGVAWRTRALLASGAERIAGLERSVDALAGSDAVLQHAWSQYALGSALRRAGRRADAVVLLEQVTAFAQAARATLLLQRAGEELDVAGAVAAGFESAPADELTQAERRVAGLAADGLTNRAIALELDVTEATVNWHLGNVYRKLGVRRSALAGALDRPTRRN